MSSLTVSGEAAGRLSEQLRNITRFMGAGKELIHLALHRDTNTVICKDKHADVSAILGDNVRSNGT